MLTDLLLRIIVFHYASLTNTQPFNHIGTCRSHYNLAADFTRDFQYSETPPDRTRLILLKVSISTQVSSTKILEIVTKVSTLLRYLFGNPTLTSAHFEMALEMALRQTE